MRKTNEPDWTPLIQKSHQTVKKSDIGYKYTGPVAIKSSSVEENIASNLSIFTAPLQPEEVTNLSILDTAWGTVWDRFNRFSSQVTRIGSVCLKEYIYIYSGPGSVPSDHTKGSDTT